MKSKRHSARVLLSPLFVQNSFPLPPARPIREKQYLLLIARHLQLNNEE
jgi:hypothetical protein